jgi:hypothetical protein
MNARFFDFACKIKKTGIHSKYFLAASAAKKYFETTPIRERAPRQGVF